MTKVYALPEVIDYLEKLVDILYEKEYFSFEDTSIEYVVDLFEDIITNLPKRTSKPSPDLLIKYGDEYVAFPKNRQTTRYAFFDKYKDKEDIYYIRCKWYIFSMYLAKR